MNKSKNNSEVVEYSVSDIMEKLELKKAYLITLSSCETALPDIVWKTDEYIGLNTALHYAGAPTVISSLWNVDDRITLILMKKMYENIFDNMGKSEALRKAQLWVKDPNNRPEILDIMKKVYRLDGIDFDFEEILPEDLSSLYYWAGFICSGAP